MRSFNVRSFGDATEMEIGTEIVDGIDWDASD